MNLTNELIRLSSSPVNKEQAIREVCQILVDNGKVEADYIEGMLAREGQENTYLGNGVAIPHGTPQSRHLIKETAIAVLQVPEGVDWEDGEPAYLIVGIAAGSNEHLAVLKSLTKVVGDEEVAEKLAHTKDVNEIREALSAVAQQEKPAEAPAAKKDGEKHYIIGITSCPTGVAHTYMAQEALERAAKEIGEEIKIETQGSVGAENVLTDEDIKRADVVIISADTGVDKSRFVGKRLHMTGTKAAINDGVKVIQDALKEAKVYQAAQEEGAASSQSASKEKVGVYKHLMTGVSYMLPFVIAGGLLIALGFALASFSIGERSIYIYEDQYRGTLAATLFWIGKDAFALFVPVLGGYIAYSIAGRPGIAAGMVGGLIANNTQAGFLGAIVAGFIAGYAVDLLNKIIKLPRTLDSLKPTLILPLFGTMITGLLMYFVIATPVADALAWLTNWLKSLQGANSIFLGALLAGMMATDMGGPINKAAYAFSVGLIGEEVFTPMAATMAGGMTPPLAICLATFIFHNRFSEEERQSGKATGILGAAFITEGAIPFAARDPLRVIPALAIGSAVAGGMSMLFDCALRVPHGGVFVMLIPNACTNVLYYLLSIVVGTLVSTALLGAFKKKIA